MAKVRCCLKLQYTSEEGAEKLLQALEVDDEEHIATAREGNFVIANAEADTLPSLMHTLNDYLACLSAAEKLVQED